MVAALGSELPVETLRDERVPAEAIGTYYDSQNYERDDNFHLGLFDSADEEFRIASDRLLREFFAQIEPLRGKTVLEIGCGLGHGAVRLVADYGCAHVDAVTISRVQHELCLRAAQRAMVSDRVNFLLADANEMEFPRHKYDIVIAMECIFHLDRDRVLAKVATSLRDDGVFAFCDIYPVEGGIAYSASGEHAFISPTQSIRLLRKHGFRDIRLLDWSDRVRPSYRVLYGHAASIARLALRAGLSQEQTFEMAERVLQRKMTPEIEALLVEEVLAQSRGSSKTDSNFGYCFIRGTRR
jgi:27-O-demethylrifamycin SV methyltransferase